MRAIGFIAGIYMSEQFEEERVVHFFCPLFYSATVDASSYTYQFYSGGVFYEEDCSTSKLNHAVLVAGYGSDNGVPYWIVKNRYKEENPLIETLK